MKGLSELDVVKQYLKVISMLETLARSLKENAESGEAVAVTPPKRGVEPVTAINEIEHGGLELAIKGIKDVFYGGAKVNTTSYLGYIVVPESNIREVKALVEQVNSEKKALHDMHSKHLKKFETSGVVIARLVQERLLDIDMTRADNSEKLLYGKSPMPRITQATRQIKVVDTPIEKLTIYSKAHRRVEKLTMEKALKMIESLSDSDMEIAEKMLSGATPSKLRYLYHAESSSYIANIKSAVSGRWSSTPANTPLITTREIDEVKYNTDASDRVKRKDTSIYLPLVKGLGIYEQE